MITYNYKKAGFFGQRKQLNVYFSNDMICIFYVNKTEIPALLRPKIANRYNISQTKIEVVDITNSKVKVKINW